MKKPSKICQAAIGAALSAGELLKKAFGTTFEITSKPGKHNLVTECDKAAEHLIIKKLSAEFPTHGFLAEEGGQTKTGDIMWIIDPLDGTVNFAHNIPIFSVSIAATEGMDVLCGVVFHPMTGELFVAEKGQGAFLNDRPIHVSPTPKLEQAYMTTGFPYNVDEDPLHCIETFDKLTRLGIPIRRLGSAAIDLSYVAAGRFDAYWEVSLQPWDVAAGLLIVEEAGGRVTHYDGKRIDPRKDGTVLASNGHLHDELLHQVSTV
jgi:myo-inositol-1(or 4)-monophosphatase